MCHSKNVIPIHPDTIVFDLTRVAESNDVLAMNDLMSQIKLKFVQDLRTMCYPGCMKIRDTNVMIRIATLSSDSKITWNTDESYSLQMNTTGTILL